MRFSGRPAGQERPSSWVWQDEPGEEHAIAVDAPASLAILP